MDRENKRKILRDMIFYVIILTISVSLVFLHNEWRQADVSQSHKAQVHKLNISKDTGNMAKEPKGLLHHLKKFLTGHPINISESDAILRDMDIKENETTIKLRVKREVSDDGWINWLSNLRDKLSG